MDNRDRLRSLRLSLNGARKCGVQVFGNVGTLSYMFDI